MSDISLLPPGFEDLNRFVAVWAQTTSEARMEARCAASMADIQTFYDAMTERAEAALNHIERFPLDALPADSARLFCLVLALAQAHVAIEIHGAVRAPNTPYPTVSASRAVCRSTVDAPPGRRAIRKDCRCPTANWRARLP